jgi:tetratricopeptide (TPR) repeat protein
VTAEEQADALVGVWIDLLREWTEVDSDAAVATTFADDLRTQVKSRVLAPAARRRLAAVFDESRTAGLLPYAVAALQAVAAREYDLVNPHRSGWADLYFGMEVWLAERPGDPSPRALALRLTPDEVAGTIDYLSAWDACRRLLEPLIHDRPHGAGRFETVERTAAALGFPHLARAVIQASALGARAADGSVVDAGQIVELAGHGDLDGALAAAYRLIEAQPVERRGELLDEVAAGLAAAFPGRTAALAAWQAGRHAADGRFDAADRVLHAAGDDDQPIPVRARLLGARAAVLTGRGRDEAAAALWRRIAELVADQPDRTQWYWARVNLALVVRDQGLAWELLYDAGYGPGGYGADADILSGLAVLAAGRDDLDTAIRLLDDAVRLANDQPAVRRRLRAQRSFLLIRRYRHEEAVAELLAAAGPMAPDPATIVNEAIGWATLLTRDAVPSTLTGTVQAMPAALADRAAQVLRNGDVAGHLTLLAGEADVRRSRRTRRC